MAIGTAQPTAEERRAAKHHLVDFLEPSDLYSAGSFEEDAVPLLSNCVQTAARPFWLEALACTSKPRCKVWTRCQPT